MRLYPKNNREFLQIEGETSTFSEPPMAPIVAKSLICSYAGQSALAADSRSIVRLGAKLSIQNAKNNMELNGSTPLATLIVTESVCYEIIDVCKRAGGGQFSKKRRDDQDWFAQERTGDEWRGLLYSSGVYVRILP